MGRRRREKLSFTLALNYKHLGVETFLLFLHHEMESNQMFGFKVYCDRKKPAQSAEKPSGKVLHNICKSLLKKQETANEVKTFECFERMNIRN